MKNVITLAIALVLTSIMIGCKSSSILKRRYNKGYYVHHATKHNEPRTLAKTNMTTQQATSESAVETIVAAPAQAAPAPVQKNTAVTASAEYHSEKTIAEKKQHNAGGHLKQAVKLAAPAAFSMQKQFKVIEQLKKKASADAADDALSLLWVIILILLIFYLLGFAFDMYGIGPLFNLLALVIVILLILWLLRIL